jgi:hypothetical protein
MVICRAPAVSADAGLFVGSMLLRARRSRGREVGEWCHGVNGQWPQPLGAELARLRPCALSCHGISARRAHGSSLLPVDVQCVAYRHRRTIDHAAESVLATRDQSVVLALGFGIQQIANRYAQAAMARGTAHAHQVTPVSVQQRQPGLAQHSEMKAERSAVRTAQVVPCHEATQGIVQGVVSDEPGQLRSLAQPAEERYWRSSGRVCGTGRL